MRANLRSIRPLHGWREFFGEVGVIVLGVVIAIGLGQLVQIIQWRGDVGSAQASLADDISRSNRAFAFRVAAHDCIAARLAKLDEIIERVARHDPVAPIGSISDDLGNGLPNNAWETSRSAQILPHFSREALRLYGAYFLQVGNEQLLMGREAENWGVLRVLEGDPRRLGAADIAGMRVSIKNASFENDLIAGIASDELATSKDLGIASPQADPRRLADVCRPV
jgi:hypothetical protein